MATLREVLKRAAETRTNWCVIDLDFDCDCMVQLISPHVTDEDTHITVHWKDPGVRMQSSRLALDSEIDEHGYIANPDVPGFRWHITVCNLVAVD